MNGNLGWANLNLECHYVLLNDSLFSFEGFVSGISNQARKTVVSAAAAMLAPYRYPKYATLKIGTDDRDDNVLVGDDVTYQEVLADLAEHIPRLAHGRAK